MKIVLYINTLLVAFLLQFSIAVAESPKHIVRAFCKGDIEYVLKNTTFPIEYVGVKENDSDENKKLDKKALREELKEWLNGLSKKERKHPEILYMGEGEDGYGCSVITRDYNEYGELESESALIFYFKEVKKGSYKLIGISLAG